MAGTVWIAFFDGAVQLQHLIYQAARFAESADGQHHVTMLAGYAVVCVVTQLIVLPSGSMILLVSGFLFGPWVATAIFSLAQILTLWPVYKIASASMHASESSLLFRLQKSLLANRTIETVKQEGVVAGIVLRLTPVIPSAAACCFAAILNIPVSAFFIATVLVCWVRPLFFASVGAALQEVSSLQHALDGSSTLSVWPVALVFVASLFLLIARVWLRRLS